MGVHNLWKILEPVQEPVKLASLRGQTLAVDLSVWICDAQGVKQMQGVVAKPHLRNLFFRVSHLLQLGVNLIFVVDGEAPELKWEAMMMRQQARFGYCGPKGSKPAKKPGRSHFRRLISECCQMLDYLGVPHVQSVGEAEAFCALLNKLGFADSVVTQDGDAFLYGATKVYKNFTISGKDAQIESYSIEQVNAKLHLNRDKLVALGLLLGCDYVPKGVPGVGKETAMKFMMAYSDSETSILDRFRQWRANPSSQSNSPLEMKLKAKSLEVKEFPFEKVIDEFMIVKDKCPKKSLTWKKPQIDKLYEFNEKMEWPASYTNEKIIPLLTLHDMRTSVKNPQHQPEPKPLRIAKGRVRQFVPCFEVQWERLECDADLENPPEFYTTFEEKEMFTDCYPHLVSAFEEEMRRPMKGEKKKRNAKKKCSDDKNSVEVITDDMVDDLKMANLSIKDSVSGQGEAASPEKGSEKGSVDFRSQGHRQPLVWASFGNTGLSRLSSKTCSDTDSDMSEDCQANDDEPADLMTRLRRLRLQSTVTDTQKPQTETEQTTQTQSVRAFDDSNEFKDDACTSQEKPFAVQHQTSVSSSPGIDWTGRKGDWQNDSDYSVNDSSLILASDGLQREKHGIKSDISYGSVTDSFLTGGIKLLDALPDLDQQTVESLCESYEPKFHERSVNFKERSCRSFEGYEGCGDLSLLSDSRLYQDPMDVVGSTGNLFQSKTSNGEWNSGTVDMKTPHDSFQALVCEESLPKGTVEPRLQVSCENDCFKLDLVSRSSAHVSTFHTHDVIIKRSHDNSVTHQVIEQDLVTPQGTKQNTVTPQAIEQDLVTPQVIKQDSVTPQVIKHNPVTPQVIKQDPMTPQVIKQDSVTPQVIKHNPVTPQVIKQDPMTPQVIKQDSVTPQVFQQEPIVDSKKGPEVRNPSSSPQHNSDALGQVITPFVDQGVRSCVNEDKITDNCGSLSGVRGDSLGWVSPPCVEDDQVSCHECLSHNNTAGSDNHLLMRGSHDLQIASHNQEDDLMFDTSVVSCAPVCDTTPDEISHELDGAEMADMQKTCPMDGEIGATGGSNHKDCLPRKTKSRKTKKGKKKKSIKKEMDNSFGVTSILERLATTDSCPSSPVINSQTNNELIELLKGFATPRMTGSTSHASKDSPLTDSKLDDLLNKLVAGTSMNVTQTLQSTDSPRPNTSTHQRDQEFDSLLNQIGGPISTGSPSLQMQSPYTPEVYPTRRTARSDEIKEQENDMSSAFTPSRRLLDMLKDFKTPKNGTQTPCSGAHISHLPNDEELKELLKDIGTPTFQGGDVDGSMLMKLVADWSSEKKPLKKEKKKKRKKAVPALKLGLEEDEKSERA